MHDVLPAKELLRIATCPGDGIEIPDPDFGDLADAAINILDDIPVAGEVIEKVTKVRELTARGAKSAGNCWGVVDRAADVVTALVERIEPLEPLFDPIHRAPEAIQLISKENLDACCLIIVDVLDFGKLLQKIMGLLKGVKSIFATIADAGEGIVDAIGEWLDDIVDKFVEAMGLDGVLDGAGEIFDQITTLIAELTDIGDNLRPIVDAWQDDGWFGAAVHGVKNFSDCKDALSRFMPAWETAKQLHEACSSLSFDGFGSAKNAWKLVRDVVRQLSDKIGIDIPDGPGARAIDIQPSVAARAGLPEVEDDDE